MRRADQITGIVMLVFSITVAYASWQMPQRVEFGPGMGFLPFWLAVIMVVLSALLFINASLKKKASAANPFPGFGALLNVGMVIVGLGVYIAALEKIGFFISTILFILYLLAVVEKEGWIKSGIISLLATGSLYTIFRVLLEVTLPRNIFGF